MCRTIPWLALLVAACNRSPDTKSDFGDGAEGAEDGTGAADSAGPDGDDGDDSPSGGDDGADGPKLDVDPGSGGGDCDCGTLEWSHVWLADSGAGYVSKLDTRDSVEVGRFLTRPDGAGDPSRTSVALSGKAVAVANRYGGIVKIWVDEKFCDDANGNGSIETSRSPGELLAWGQDECVAWYTAFPELTTQRPVAWAQGELDPESCKYTNEPVWTAGCGGGGTPGHGGSEPGITVYRLDGDTGDVIDEVEFAEFPCGSYGPYGGAVDSEGSFWLISMMGALGRVDAETLDTRMWNVGHPPLQPYGIMVDSDDRVWISSYSEWSSPRPAYGAGRFDPQTETWDYVEEPFTSQSGLAQGVDGKIWIGTNDRSDAGMYNNGGSDGSKRTGLLWIDPDTMTVGEHWPIPVWLKGVSVDKDGFVWGVGWQTDAPLFTPAAHFALKIDPDTGDYSSYDGLEDPYTYSDMTGWGIQNVACTPEG